MITHERAMIARRRPFPAHQGVVATTVPPSVARTASNACTDCDADIAMIPNTRHPRPRLVPAPRQASSRPA